MQDDTHHSSRRYSARKFGEDDATPIDEPVPGMTDSDVDSPPADESPDQPSGGQSPQSSVIRSRSEQPVPFQDMPETEQNAVTSMVLGIVSLVILIVGGCCYGVGVLIAAPMGVVAVMLGYAARTKIRDNARLTGDGMAVAGIVCGYISIGLSVLVVLALVLFMILAIVASA